MLFIRLSAHDCHFSIVHHSYVVLSFGCSWLRVFTLNFSQYWSHFTVLWYPGAPTAAGQTICNACGQLLSIPHLQKLASAAWTVGCFINALVSCVLIKQLTRLTFLRTCLSAACPRCSVLDPRYLMSFNYLMFPSELLTNLRKT